MVHVRRPTIACVAVAVASVVAVTNLVAATVQSDADEVTIGEGVATDRETIPPSPPARPVPLPAPHTGPIDPAPPARPLAMAAATVAVVGDSLVAHGADTYRAALTDAGYEVVAFEATSGASLHDALRTDLWDADQRPAPVLGARPDVLYVSFGTNDTHDRKDRALERVVADLDRFLAAVEPGTCVVWQTWKDDPAPAVTDPAYAERLAFWWDRVARSVDVVNDLGPDLEADPSLLAVDGVHLSDAGIAHNVDRMLDAVGACT